MQIALGQLKWLLRQALQEGRITVSPEYMKMDKARQELQDIIVAQIKAGKIIDAKQLATFFDHIDQDNAGDEKLACAFLKGIPFKVWKKLAST